MAWPELVFSSRAFPLYERIGYRSDLEVAAFAALAQGDVTGSRRVFERLIEALRLEGCDGSSRQIVDLLLDVLQKVNRRVHAARDDEAGYQAQRLALIEGFGAIDDPETARGHFLPALHGILDKLEQPSAAPHAMVRRAVAFINDNYQRRISLSAVARHLHVSPNYLSRVFRRETEMTLTAYVQRVRLAHATNLMRDGGRSISEIAYRVGYQNYRDFYRNFVKYQKEAPRRALQRLRPRRS